MIFYVNPEGNVSFIPPITSTPIVGPISSLVDGVTYMTAGMTINEILGLRKQQYQQLQLENDQCLA